MIIRNNAVGSYGHSNIFTGYFFAAGGNKDALVDRVTVTGNQLTQTMKVYVSGAGSTTRNGRNLSFVGNTSTATATTTVMKFTTADVVTVTGNTQPQSGGSLASFTDCTAVTYKP